MAETGISSFTSILSIQNKQKKSNLTKKDQQLLRRRINEYPNFFLSSKNNEKFRKVLHTLYLNISHYFNLLTLFITRKKKYQINLK